MQKERKGSSSSRIMFGGLHTLSEEQENAEMDATILRSIIYLMVV